MVKTLRNAERTAQPAAMRRFALLGGEVSIKLSDIDETLAEPLFEEIRAEGLRLQRIFSIYNPESELSTLNRRRELRASKELREVIAYALTVARRTHGAYDISRGKQYLARKQGRELAVACTYEDIEMDGDIIRLTHPDAHIDLGSVAKGYIGDALLAFIRRLGVLSAFVDARGDLTTAGERLEVVTIKHPRAPSRSIGRFVLENASVATSGDYRQYVASYDRSHIVGAQEFTSVTVVAPTLMEADASATALFVLGDAGAKAFLRDAPTVRALAYTKDDRTIMYNGFEELLFERQLAATQETLTTAARQLRASRNGVTLAEFLPGTFEE